MLGQFYLQLALVGGGVLPEHVQNQGRAVDELACEGVLQVTLLGWGELVIEDDHVGFEVAHHFTNFVHLT